MKGQEIINHITSDEMPDIEEVRAVCHNAATQALTHRYHLPKFATVLLTIVFLAITGGALYAAVELDVIERFRVIPHRFERFPSRLDEEPVVQEGHFFSWEWREYQKALRDYGLARLDAGLLAEGPVPYELFCCNLGQTNMYIRHNYVHDYIQEQWMRDGWTWRVTSRGYICAEGVEYIELERLAILSFKCNNCDLVDTARYSFVFTEYAWFSIASLNSEAITIDRLQLVDELYPAPMLGQ